MSKNTTWQLQQTSLSIRMTAGIRRASSSAQAASCSVMTGPIPKVDFNNERGYMVGEYLIDLVANPKFGANFDDSLVKAGFAEGTLAAAVSIGWNAGEIQKSLGDNYAATKLPEFKLSNGETVQMGSMANFKIMGVNAETKNPLDAMALAEWLTNKEQPEDQIRGSFIRSHKC